jgi:hypothetical protein
MKFSLFIAPRFYCPSKLCILSQAIKPNIFHKINKHLKSFVMNRSSSEVCFQKFLQGAEGSSLSGEDNFGANQGAECRGVEDDAVEIKASQPLDQSPADADPGEYD